MTHGNSGIAPGPLDLFCARLKRLQIAVDIKQTSLARAAHRSTSQMSDILNGNIKERPDWDIVATVVHACLEYAEGTGRPVPADLRDEGDWRRRYGDLERDLDTESRPRRQALAGWPLADVTDPFALEVHRPVQPDTPQRDHPLLPLLPVYVPREHDMELERVIMAAVQGKSSIAVLVGGSSTGKTRACWEALQLLRDRKPGWRLWHPIDPSRPEAALRDLPGIAPRTVIWLNEAQFYVDLIAGGLGERIAAGLRELVRDPTRAPVLVLATLWPQFWDRLTGRPPAGADDPHAQARELLSGRDISVPAAFAPAQLEQAAAAEDSRLALAAAAADGQVTQFLAGAPELLARYRYASPAAKALISAAADARRLGMGIALPLAFLEAAAPGYLTENEWDGLGDDWLKQALAYAAAECRGTRGPLTRIRPRPSREGVPVPGPAYRLAAYLDQHGRQARRSLLPPQEFWTAAGASLTDPGDLNALASAAENRGMLRDAARLRKHAIALGDSSAASAFINLWHSIHPRDLNAPEWVAAKVPLEDPSATAAVLGALRTAGAGEQVRTLLARDPAAHVSLDNASHLAALLGALRTAGAGEQVTTLLARDPAAHVSVDDPFGIAELLTALRAAGGGEQVDVLASRVAMQASLDDTYDVVWLLRALGEAGEPYNAQILARRAASHITLDDPYEFGDLLEVLLEVGADEQVSALLSRNPAARISLDSPLGVAKLLGMLRAADAYEQVSALLARDPAAHVNLDEPSYVAELLELLWAIGEDEQASALLARDPAAHVAHYDPSGVAELLRMLRDVGADGQVSALLARDPAAHVTLDQTSFVSELLGALREVGAHEQVRLLVNRLPAEGMFDLFRSQGGHDHQTRYRFGRQPDGSPARPWNWGDLY